MNKIKTISTVIAGVALVAGLAACSSNATEIKDIPAGSSSDMSGTSTPAPIADATVVAPIVLTPADANGKTVEAVVGQGIDIDVPDQDEANWTATVTDPAVLVFMQGGTQGTAVTNPGFQVMTSGTSDVTMTNGKTGETVTFKVNVK